MKPFCDLSLYWVQRLQHLDLLRAEEWYSSHCQFALHTTLWQVMDTRDRCKVKVKQYSSEAGLGTYKTYDLHKFKNRDLKEEY